MYVVGQLGGGGLERQLWYLLSVLDCDVYRPSVVYVQKLWELGVPHTRSSAPMVLRHA
jgi:hypothetical protein